MSIVSTASAIRSGLSVLSYNVLIPNSVDGWWVYKTYSPRNQVELSSTSWNYRQRLIEDLVRGADADVVCFQETSAASFQADFAFMQNLGYDGQELYKKGRFRPATFWRSNRVTQWGPILHRDRCLVTAFADASIQKDSCSISPLPPEIMWVANVHLSAGGGNGQNERRLRQIFDCTDSIRKEQNKVLDTLKKLPRKKDTVIDKPVFGVIIAGDTNVEGRVERLSRGLGNSAVDELLTQGIVSPDFLEDGKSLCSKDKVNKLGLFFDAYESVYTSPPATMVVEELYGVITESIDNGDDTEQLLSGMAKELIGKVFDSFACLDRGNETVMSSADVTRWLLNINLKLGRGSEYRGALKAMLATVEGSEQQEKVGIEQGDIGDAVEGEAEAEEDDSKLSKLPEAGYLSRQNFIDIYENEIKLGKVWSVVYDLSACGHGLPPLEGLFKSRFDKIYVSGAEAKVLGVQDTEAADMLSPCPNAQRPSDHLPIMAIVSWRK